VERQPDMHNQPLNLNNNRMEDQITVNHQQDILPHRLLPPKVTLVVDNRLLTHQVNQVILLLLHLLLPLMEDQPKTTMQSQKDTQEMTDMKMMISQIPILKEVVEEDLKVMKLLL